VFVHAINIQVDELKKSTSLNENVVLFVMCYLSSESLVFKNNCYMLVDTFFHGTRLHIFMELGCTFSWN